MKHETSGFARLFAILLLVIIAAVALVSGCRIIDVGGNDSSDPAAVSTIAGRVVKPAANVANSRESERSALLTADISRAVGIAGAEVWLESLASDPRFRTVTDASGTYLFTAVPPGEHRVIVKYIDPATGKTMKVRSAVLQVTDTPALVAAPDLIGEPALNVVTGQLCDADGNFLTEGTVLTLWGESFIIGKDGVFTSPALPESASEAEILVQFPGGNNVPSFTAPFVSDIVPVFVELKVGAADDGNHAPTVFVSASVAGKAVCRVNPGTVVTLLAVGSDTNGDDHAALVPTWSATSGTLADGASAFEKRWTAPDYFTVATITVEVKDPQNATGKARLPILVGVDSPSLVDTVCPNVALIADKESVTDSAAFNVTITFNESVKDFEDDDIAVTNAVLSDFTTVTASKVFKVKVTPQAAGEVMINVAENVATDLSNNKNSASNILTLTNSITPAKSSEKAITAFSFPSLSVTGTINSENKTIAVTVPFGTDVSALVASFTASAKTTVMVGAAAQISDETANDFSSPITYKITAEDGSTSDYTVTVTITQPAQVTALNLGSLVTAPVKGVAPLTTVIDHPQYTSGAINWFEADGSTPAPATFAAAKVYVAKFTLSAKAGYTLTGVAADSFSCTGATSVNNSADSGAVTITFVPTAFESVISLAATTGTPQSGQTLTAGALIPADATVDYQWQVSDDGLSSWVDIAGATANTYAVDLTKTAVGKYVRVVATGNAIYGGTVNSAATQIDATPVTAVAAISGTPRSGQTLTAGALTPVDATVDYQWQVSDDGLSSWVDIADATANTYAVDITKTPAGKYVRVVATGNANYGGTVNSTATEIDTTPVTAVVATSSGTPRSGQVLTASALTPADATVEYQWQVSDDGSSGWSNIADETANTYVVDLGKTAVDKYVRVAATGKDSSSGTVYSSALIIWGDYISENIGTLKYVPAGAFQRDSTSANISTVSAFRMSQHEITRAQFLAIMGTDPTAVKYSSGMSDPVERASWYHAIAFCNRLSIVEGLTPAYTISGSTDPTVWGAVPTLRNAAWDAVSCNWSANGYRLPTEMEWMWAAMGADSDDPGATNTTGYLKPFAGSNGSNSLDAYAWYVENSNITLHPVGTKLPNELGLNDMSGNVMEWCWDWANEMHPEYEITGLHHDYRGAEPFWNRVVRGGCFMYGAIHHELADRFMKNPVEGIIVEMGFRVVRP